MKRPSKAYYASFFGMTPLKKEMNPPPTIIVKCEKKKSLTITHTEIERKHNNERTSNRSI